MIWKKSLFIVAVLALFSGPFVPALGADQASFVGSDKCKLCHPKIYDEWTATAHGKLLSAEVADSAKGCEACHGPGSLHVASTGKKKLVTAAPDNLKGFDAVCNSCHAATSGNAMPREWQKLDAAYWSRSAHSRKGLACLNCHAAHSSVAKLLKQEAADLCVKCHSALIAKPSSYTHTPVKQKQCLTCHNPHGSSQPQMVKSGVQAICVTCHKAGADLNKSHGGYDVGASNCVECHDPHSHDKANSLLRKRRHGPFKSMGCGSCHKPAGSNGAIALLKPQKELCVSCHSKGLPEGDGVHRPVAEGMCTACHSPHVSDAEKGLLRTARVADACFTCHSSVQTVISEAKFKHKPLEDLNCLQCHKPHSSSEGRLLKKASIDLCQDCHKPHLHPYGKKPDGSEVIDPTTKKMLVCASCHEPHGSEWGHLTKDNHERELCVRCHKEGMHG
ncbi:MAG: cytochrome c3 family protein [Armatimonadota bacterium]|nr:cytochrome c3 family protein [Armatimonadota bacterium]